MGIYSKTELTSGVDRNGQPIASEIVAKYHRAFNTQRAGNVGGSQQSEPATKNREIKPRPLCGTSLKSLLASLGQIPTVDPLGQRSCSCQSLAREMDRHGPDWCRDHRDEIAAQLKASADHRGWGAKLRAGTLAITTGVAWRLDPRDPYGSLVDEAIRRAEECTK